MPSSTRSTRCPQTSHAGDRARFTKSERRFHPDEELDDELCPGTLEIRWHAATRDPGVPLRLDVSHGPHEYVEEAAMHRCAAVYALFAGGVPGRQRRETPTDP